MDDPAFLTVSDQVTLTFEAVAFSMSPLSSVLAVD